MVLEKDNTASERFICDRSTLKAVSYEIQGTKLNNSLKRIS